MKVINVVSGDGWDVPTGKAFSVPAADYAVVARILEADGVTETLAARTVPVSGAYKTTLDARQGQLLNVSLDAMPGDQYSQVYDARICVGTWSMGVESFNWAGSLYVVPNASKYLHFAYVTGWRPWGSSPSDVYAVSELYTGVPGGLNKVVPVSSLATVNFTARRGPAGGPETDFALQPQATTQTTNCQQDLYVGAYNGPMPFTVKAHVSGGTWDIRSDTYTTQDDGQNAYIGSYFNTQALVGGRSYSFTYYKSAWGPGLYIPTVYDGTIMFLTDGMFTDPTQRSFEASNKTVATLALNGSLLTQQTMTAWEGAVSTFSYKISSPGWYTLTANATRYRPGITYPAYMLSTGATAVFHFYAKPTSTQMLPVWLTHFFPQGLDDYNRAPANGRTKINLLIDRPIQGVGDLPAPSSVIKSVEAWSSTTGTTWRKAVVSQIGSQWSMTVINPPSGTVWLRAKVTDTSGNYSIITIRRAYAIG